MTTLTRSTLPLILLALMFVGPACSVLRGLDAATVKREPVAVDAAAPIPGADRTEEYLPYLQGKRVAMMVNQSSTIGGQPSVDVLVARGVKVVRVFGPEHGFRGNASNGAEVADEIDAKTGVPIVSLYGARNRPTTAEMSDIDVLIYDIQDVGVRFYTNINALRTLMDACAEHGKELLILDRPNPNAYMVDGPILDMKLRSGIGQFPIPIAHGLTVAEFAQMVNGEGWLTNPSYPKCRLKIIPVANYTHDTPYVLPVNPSPNLNTPQAILVYPSTCLFEGTILNHGRGTHTPFTVIGAPALIGRYPFAYTPISLPGMAEDPVHQDQVCYGLDLRDYDVEQLRQSRRINLKWMMELYAAYPDKSKFFDRSYHRQIGNIDFLSGTSEFKNQIIAGASEDEIRASWEPGLSQYKEMRKKYLLYP